MGEAGTVNLFCRKPAFSSPLSFLSAVLFCLISTSVSVSGAEKQFTDLSDKTELNLGQPIMTGSERVTRNDTLLQADRDYQVRGGEGVILILTPLTASDTVVIRYNPIPIWLRKFGRSIPQATQSVTRPEAHGGGGTAITSRESSDISISGAKSFRVTSRTSGPADFSQTLDLKISGELSPGLFIEGNVTDRDLDPVYSSLNSRLSELDRMNIRVFSNSFEAELGDLTPGRRPGLSRAQQMTGLGFSVTELNWGVNGTLARPRGEFVTLTLSGQDALQGPYRLNSAGRAYPVVPGSETVWLDGHKLERGTDKDYQIDYTLGEVSFNVTHPIDSRSRIEVDFEPQTTTFKKELYSGGGSVHTHNSVGWFQFQVVREGDDSGERLLGELSEAETTLLAQSSDSLVWTSGVIADTSGDYILIVDSLPDTVYQWVDTDGEYAISFSYIGPGEGAYRLLGNGVYEYVGPGVGEYLPLKRLSAPQRTSHYQMAAGTKNELTGETRLNWNISSFDKNLFSANDNTNNGNLIELTNRRAWQRKGRPEQFGFSYRLLEPEYRTRDRVYQPEFRRSFALPTSFIQETDERLLTSSVDLSPITGSRVGFAFNRLDYQDRFNSTVGQASLRTDWSERFQTDLSYESGNSSIDSGSVSLDGERYNFQTGVQYVVPAGWHLSGRFERDRRKNSYYGEKQGTRYAKLGFETGVRAELLRYEYYAEDSLIGAWTEQLKRHRVSLQSNRQIDKLRYSFTLTHQWLDRLIGNETSFLGRLNLRYDDPVKRLTSTASYLISDEQKNQRGIIYYQVAPGEGDYILDENAPGGPQYIPDEQGDYIRLEEQLSERSAIRRGERSFLLNKAGTGWQFRFDSRHNEELLATGERPWWWVVPFLTDESAAYLYFSGRHNADLRLIDLGGFYLINLSGARQKESRLVGSESPTKVSVNTEITIKERVKTIYLEQSLSLFRSDRDTYYSGIGEVNGHRARLAARRSVATGEVGLGVGRRVGSTETDEKVVTYLVDLSGRVPLFARGKLRTEIEWYRHQFSNLIGPASYQLTDNRPGSEGAVWSVSLQYGLNRDLRGNFTLSGRHSDDRRGRILARGELIASF